MRVALSGGWIGCGRGRTRTCLNHSALSASSPRDPLPAASPRSLGIGPKTSLHVCGCGGFEPRGPAKNHLQTPAAFVRRSPAHPSPKRKVAKGERGPLASPAVCHDCSTTGTYQPASRFPFDACPPKDARKSSCVPLHTCRAFRRAIFSHLLSSCSIPFLGALSGSRCAGREPHESINDFIFFPDAWNICARIRIA